MKPSLPAILYSFLFFSCIVKFLFLYFAVLFRCCQGDVPACQPLPQQDLQYNPSRIVRLVPPFHFPDDYLTISPGSNINILHCSVLWRKKEIRLHFFPRRKSFASNATEQEIQNELGGDRNGKAP
jgi:hypothetical protein